MRKDLTILSLLLRNRPHRRFVVFAAMLLTCTLVSQAGEKTPQGTTNAVAQPIELAGIHNAFQVTPRIYSGSQPAGEEAFAALKKLGVKTILSVDGSKPDVETARKYGLRYVHLPFGYDGVPTNRVAELAKLTSELAGPFFVHCHHGKHRGPAAVAVICEASEGWTPGKAVAFLKEAGTADDYPGLYRAAQEFKAPSAAQLAAVKDFPEINKSSSLVDAMVAMDEHFERLKQCQAAGWKTPTSSADISPAHEAMMVWEGYKEIVRLPDATKRPADFRAKLSDAEKTADVLRLLLKDSSGSAKLDAALKQASQSCATCHKKYRNE